MKKTTGFLVFLLALVTQPVPYGVPSGIGVAALHPVILCDHGWRFHLGDVAGASDPAFNDLDWRTLDLPHDWSIELPFDAKMASGTGYLPGGIGWYRKALELAGLEGMRISVRFDGVYMNSGVWINGHLLGKRPYGYVSFEYDLTPYLAPAGKKNLLAVRVDHSKYGDSRWYTGSGIYRHVWLIATADLHIAPWGTSVTTPDVTNKSATIAIGTSINNESLRVRDVLLRTTVKDRDGKIVATVENRHPVGPGAVYRFEQNAAVLAPRFWSPENPYLYSVVNLVREGNTNVDECVTPLGIRTILFDPDKGFFLNGVKTLLKGVCIHHDAGSLGAAVPDQVLRRRLQLLKGMGCNAIRTSHNPPAPELLEMCDSMGFLVMDEAFDEWAKPKKKWIEGWNAGTPGLQGYAEYFDEWSIRDIQSMVERDKNHPSIVLWSIGNEIDYEKDPYYDPEAKDYKPDKPSAADLPSIAAKLIKAIKDIDSSRPITAALANITVSNKFGLADLLDVVGYNYLEKNYTPDHTRYPGRKIFGSENSHAYSAWKVVEELTFVGGQFLWTGFDYLGEARQWPVRSSGSGVLDECGFKKPAYYFRQSLWSDHPMVYVAAKTPSPRPEDARAARSEIVPSWNWPIKDGDPVNVVAYSNCERVELLLNGKSLGEKTLVSAQDRVLSWDVPYATGTLRAIGRNGNKAVSSWELKTTGPAARLKLAADATTLQADGRDVVHVEVSVVDSNGIVVYSANNPIHFELVGQGRIIGIDSGDIRSHESFQASARNAYQGRCLVMIQSAREPGTIRLKAAATGLIEDEIAVTVSPAKR